MTTHPHSGRKINHELLEQINRELESGERNIERDGGWRCNGCGNLTVLDNSGEQSKCAICGSLRLKRLPKIEDAVQTPIPRQRFGERAVSVERAHLLFEQMRAELD